MPSLFLSFNCGLFLNKQRNNAWISWGLQSTYCYQVISKMVTSDWMWMLSRQLDSLSRSPILSLREHLYMVTGFIPCQNQLALPAPALWDCLWRVRGDITSVGAGIKHVRGPHCWYHHWLALLWSKPYIKADHYRPSSDSMYTLAFFWLAVGGTCKHPEKAERKASFCQRQSVTTSVARVQVKAAGKKV